MFLEEASPGLWQLQSPTPYCCLLFSYGEFPFSLSPQCFSPSNPKPILPLNILSLHLLHSFLLDVLLHLKKERICSGASCISSWNVFSPSFIYHQFSVLHWSSVLTLIFSTLFSFSYYSFHYFFFFTYSGTFKITTLSCRYAMEKKILNTDHLMTGIKYFLLFSWTVLFFLSLYNVHSLKWYLTWVHTPEFIYNFPYKIESPLSSLLRFFEAFIWQYLNCSFPLFPSSLSRYCKDLTLSLSVLAISSLLQKSLFFLPSFLSTFSFHLDL